MAGARFSVFTGLRRDAGVGRLQQLQNRTTGGDPAELAAEKERADAAEAARDAAEATLSELRGSLENAQAALKAVGSGANARVEANRALTPSRRTWRRFRVD